MQIVGINYYQQSQVKVNCEVIEQPEAENGTAGYLTSYVELLIERPVAFNNLNVCVL